MNRAPLAMRMRATEALVKRATGLARWVVVPFVLLGFVGSAMLFALLFGLQALLFGLVFVKLTAFVSLPPPVWLAVVSARKASVRLIAARRPGWIAEAAREFEVDSKSLEESFTMDSW